MQGKTGIEALRRDIDVIDRQILHLLNRRAARVMDIVHVRKEDSTPSFDPARERRIVERLKRMNRGPLGDKDIEIFTDALFKIFRSLGRPFTVAYFGPRGTFTHQAAMKRFGDKHVYVACKTVESVFREVEKKRADFGVVPVENSSEGVVTHTLDMFQESDLKIASEILLEIHHYLLSSEKSLASVRKVYSHPQALAQCQNWIEEHLARVTLIETESTATAVLKARREKGAAAIGSEVAGRIYGLKTLAQKIEDFRENVTRFLVIGQTSSERSGNDRTSILFSVKDRVGALHDILVPFKSGRINLTRIESRPDKKRAWQYVFFVDFLGHRDDPRVRTALASLERNCTFLKVLGSYPKGG